MDAINKEWKFGILRSVSINENTTTWEYYDYLTQMDGVKALMKEDIFQVIGEIDSMHPIIQKQNSKTVYALLEMESYQLIPLASSLNSLIPFLDSAEKMWLNSPNDTILDTTHENIQQAQQIIELFLNENPGIDSAFWEMECFAGLNIGFSLE